MCTRTHVNIRFFFLTELEENALILMCRADGRTVIMMSHLSPVQLFVHFDFCDSCEQNELTLHEEVKIGSGELLMDGLQQDVIVLSSTHPSFSLPSSGCHSGRRGRLELRRVGETVGGAINQSIQSDERQRDGDDAPQTAPAVAENRNIGNDAEQRFGRPERENKDMKVRAVVWKINEKTNFESC